MASRKARVVGQPLTLGEIKHVSYSTLDQWFTCPHRVELAKIQKAPQTPAWWFAGGSAVHTATENYDRWTLLDPVERGRFSVSLAFQTAFEIEVQEIREKEPDETKWRSAGPKDAPETYDRWMKNGPLFVSNYIKWRRSTEYQIWTGEYALDPGITDETGKFTEQEVGIEIDLSFTPKTCDREIKAYADRIFWHPGLEQIHIIDLKTGTRGPNSPLQFGTYAAGLMARFGVKAATGMAFMNREGKPGKAFDLAKYTPEYIGRLYGALSRAVDARVFPAHKGSACRMCDVGSSCYANDGELAELYDPDHPNYAPRF